MTWYSASTRRSLRYLSPVEDLSLHCGLSLSPRLKLLLTFFRTDPAVKPVDEWQLTLSLLTFLRTAPISLPLSPSSAETGDVVVRRLPDLYKRRRDEPVAIGTLYVRDLSFLRPSEEPKSNIVADDGDREEKAMRAKYLEWRSSVVEKLEGIELNLEGVKFMMKVQVPDSDDFENMEKSWEQFYKSKFLDGRQSSRETMRRPDTIEIRGLPSRWLAEPRVSSKPSLLVTHTIFSVLGKIRNVYVDIDDTIGKAADKAERELVSGLNCKVLVQFESFDNFYDAMKVLCGRSLQKEGSRLKVDYDIGWDRSGFFRNQSSGSHLQERISSFHAKKETFAQPQPFHDHSKGVIRKRFRDY